MSLTFPPVKEELTIAQLQEKCYQASRTAGWYTNVITGEPIPVDVPLKLMLIGSEVFEAFDGVRKNQMDDHLPHRTMLEAELADTIIRVMDLAGALGLDMATTITEKMHYNLHRNDHKLENRKLAGGKTF